MSKIDIYQYKLLHEITQKYGASGSKYFKDICLIIDILNPKTILDYGCGKGALVNQISEAFPHIDVYGYDPAIEGKNELPLSKKVDLLLNTDVLEHIPEEEIESVINQISNISKNCYFALDHALADTILPNGKNAHCTIKPVYWYERLFSKYFKEITILESPESWKSVVLTFGVNDSFYKKYYGYKKAKVSKLTILKYTLLSIITFGKKRIHYKNKLNNVTM